MPWQRALLVLLSAAGLWLAPTFPLAAQTGSPPAPAPAAPPLVVDRAVVPAEIEVPVEPPLVIDADGASTTPATDPASGDPAVRSQMPWAALMASLTIFVLAIFVGFEVITKVPPTLHTPLMSGSNAISGITVVGALIIAGGPRGPAAYVGLVAVALAAINVVGGFLVTHRMLSMFRKRNKLPAEGQPIVAENPLLDVAYIVAAVLFIFGLKNMAHPRTAVRGNLLGASAMLLAILLALVGRQGYGMIAVALAAGGVIGAVLAVKIQMTSMPQLVALFNGFGGGASVLVAGAALLTPAPPQIHEMVATAASGLIGAVTFWGSLVAFAKLQELQWFKRPLHIPGQQLINGLLGAAVIGLAVIMVVRPDLVWVYGALVLLASVLGVMLVNPIGGADMPVVIALLNSYSGLAAAATGFVVNNNVLIIAGSLVGASGIILTQLMCKAMNRSLFNVLFGVMEVGTAVDADEIYATVRSTSAEDVAMILETAQRVVFVPGYGLAVAQAQHAVRNLAKMLEDRGIHVEYAIHPVAGRMPGHMNVLLAEADVPYEQLREMDDINPTMETVDVAIVIGANDVVNPVARTDPKSPIAGMPIIEVDKARTAVIIKRSLSPGFAGIPNPLFAAENTLMLFGDGQRVVLDIISAVKEG